MTDEDIRSALAANWRPPHAALHAAVGRAEALAPAILAAIEKTIDGVFLMPEQQRFVLFGIHVLAAARVTALFRPLIRLVRLPEQEWGPLLGEAESLPQIVISVFDGNAAPLVEAIEDPATDPVVRMMLFGALARLAFDGAVPRARVADLVARFDRERPADDGDPAWIGWLEAILFLRLEDDADRARAAFGDGRIDANLITRERWEEDWQRMQENPADPGRWQERGLVPMRDPVEGLAWHFRQVEQDAPPDHSRRRDPAEAMALTAEEAQWLEEFLASRQAGNDAMSFEAADGLFCASAAGPETVEPGPMIEMVLSFDGAAGVAFDSQAQADLVNGLLSRHWHSLAVRLAARYPHLPEIATGHPDDLGADWASGFMLGVAQNEAAWQPLLEDVDYRDLLVPILDLHPEMAAEPEAGAKPPKRLDLVDEIPEALVDIAEYWRQRRRSVAVPTRPHGRKVGRNEPCPCGSGRKYKQCCGAAA